MAAFEQNKMFHSSSGLLTEKTYIIEEKDLYYRKWMEETLTWVMDCFYVLIVRRL
jgi:hypothetical protein